MNGLGFLLASFGSLLVVSGPLGVEYGPAEAGADREDLNDANEGVRMNIRDAFVLKLRCVGSSEGYGCSPVRRCIFHAVPGRCR